jgi:predicted nucleic acid-binding protein
MIRFVLLDAGPLGAVANPRATALTDRHSAWLEALLAQGVIVLVPEIADYEVRRELLRAGKTASIQRLDELKSILGYLPITTEAMLRAAEFWAEARRRGQPTAPDQALDADVILAAQAAVIERGEEDEVVVATTNPDHLARFVDARHWEEIE